MKTSVRFFAVTARLIFFGGLLLFLASCTQEPPPSLYDPSYVGGAQPVITSVNPASNGLALVTVLTITGQNFIPDVTKNIVYFNSKPGLIQSATTTQIVVKAPDVVADTVWIKVAAFGSTLFSDPPYRYKLESATVKVGTLGPTERPYAVTVDGQGNLYFSVVSLSGGAETGQGVKKLASDGTKTDFATTGGGAVTSFTGMKFGPGGLLFGAANRPAIYQMTGNNSDPTVWLSLARTEKTSDFDFDASGNMWAGGGIQKIYRITPAKAVKIIPFFASSPRVLVRSVRVYNGYLYLGGAVDSIEGVWRTQIISSDSLGTPELYFDFTATTRPTTYAVNAVTFAQNGDMYLGTASPGAILIVHPDKSVEALYPGAVAPTTYSLAWGIAGDLYQAQQTTAAGALLRINMLQQRSAPYYGRQ
jgi:hypothetical protein